MTKTFCDKCGDEIPRSRTVFVVNIERKLIHEAQGMIPNNRMEVCESCVGRIQETTPRVMSSHDS